MSFLSSLFGGGKSTPQFAPRATPTAPRIGGAAGESARRENRRAQSATLDEDKTILAGLGSVGSSGSSSGSSGSVKRSTLLGG